MELKVRIDREALASCMYELARRHPAPELQGGGLRTGGRLQFHLAWTAAAPSAVEGAGALRGERCDLRAAERVFDLYRRDPDLFDSGGVWEELAAAAPDANAHPRLKAMAGGMLREYGGCGATLLAASKGWIDGRRGLRMRLSRLAGFAPGEGATMDLFVWAIIREGIFAPADPGFARYPVTGMLFGRLLRDGAFTIEEKNRWLRQRRLASCARLAPDAVVRLSRVLGRIPGVATLDPLLGQLRPPRATFPV